MEHSLLQDGLKLLALAVFAVLLFRRLNLPAILGYILIGVLAGPHLLDWIQGSDTTTLLGEVGVVFLLFTIGLEFSIQKFIQMRYTLLGLGGTQVIIGTVSGMIIALLIGIPWQAALIMGGALSLSSTAIVIKLLTDQTELQQEHGRISVGILLFQDIAAVPFLVIIPILASGGEQSLLMPLVMALAKGIMALVVMLVFGRWVLRPLFREVAHAHSMELFTLTVLFVALAAAWLTHGLGLSLALGAFTAGIMLSETEYRHQIEADIRPFRDVLLGFFFITVGMQFDISSLYSSWPWVMLLVIGIIFGKGLVIIAVTKLAGYSLATAFRSGVILAQGSEFGIALISLAVITGLISTAELQPILACIIISMAISPILIRCAELINNRFFVPTPDLKQTPYNEITENTATLERHVIICGFGHTGQHIAHFLQEENIKYAALDTDANIVKAAWEAEKQVFYGNATDPKLLAALNLAQATAVIISFENTNISKQIIQHIRQTDTEKPIIARAHDQESMNILMTAGATEAVPEELETSLMLATQLLIILEVPVDDVIHRIKTIKEKHYKTLRNATSKPE